MAGAGERVLLLFSVVFFSLLSGCSGSKSSCGNGKAEGFEQCDGLDLREKTCLSFGHSGGTLICQADCTLDARGCTDCGNGRIDQGEECDRQDLGGETCQDLGHASGTLACKADCTYDESGCGN